nr:fumagillin dodecapentaenoate synthase [Quercus suber]
MWAARRDVHGVYVEIVPPMEYQYMLDHPNQSYRPDLIAAFAISSDHVPWYSRLTGELALDAMSRLLFLNGQHRGYQIWKAPHLCQSSRYQSNRKGAQLSARPHHCFDLNAQFTAYSFINMFLDIVLLIVSRVRYFCSQMNTNELVQPRSDDHLRHPEYSRTLVTALQILQVQVLRSWNIIPGSVVGHLSGEIAAAYAADLITAEEAIKIAFLRDKASQEQTPPVVAVGMLTTGIGASEALGLLYGTSEFACFNSPESVTLTGLRKDLEHVMNTLHSKGKFARMLRVDVAYHSSFMVPACGVYESLMLENINFPPRQMGDVQMFSSVSGKRLDSSCDASYWKSNMRSPVQFENATRAMLTDAQEYCAALRRTVGDTDALYEIADRIFAAGGRVPVTKVNEDGAANQQPRVVIDLPNYAWNHATKYWHENDASRDWRFQEFRHHDLLGSKVYGSSWQAPSWKKILRIEDLPWLKDLKVHSLFTLYSLVDILQFTNLSLSARTGDYFPYCRICGYGYGSNMAAEPVEQDEFSHSNRVTVSIPSG